jgi:hypothetical protein
MAGSQGKSQPTPVLLHRISPTSTIPKLNNQPQNLAQGRNAALWIHVDGTSLASKHHGACVRFQL